MKYTWLNHRKTTSYKLLHCPCLLCHSFYVIFIKLPYFLISFSQNIKYLTHLNTKFKTFFYCNKICIEIFRTLFISILLHTARTCKFKQRHCNLSVLVNVARHLFSHSISNSSSTIIFAVVFKFSSKITYFIALLKKPKLKTSLILKVENIILNNNLEKLLTNWHPSVLGWKISVAHLVITDIEMKDVVLSN